MAVEWITPPTEYDPNKSMFENKHRDRGTLRCDCGQGVNLSSAARGPNYVARCGCGQHYNLVGQQLTPPSQWEE